FGFVGAARAIEMVGELVSLEHAGQTQAGFAGGNPQPDIVLLELLAQGHHAVEQDLLPVMEKEVVTITVDEARDLILLQTGGAPHQGLFQGKADHPAGVLHRGNGKFEVGAGRLDGTHNGRRGIHHSAVPVEDHCFVTLHFSCSRVFRICTHSGGSGASSTRGSPVSGCGISSRAACRNIRLNPSFAKCSRTASMPYFSSPTMGKPLDARCTLI